MISGVRHDHWKRDSPLERALKKRAWKKNWRMFWNVIHQVRLSLPLSKQDFWVGDFPSVSFPHPSNIHTILAGHGLGFTEEKGQDFSNHCYSMFSKPSLHLKELATNKMRPFQTRWQKRCEISLIFLNRKWHVPEQNYVAFANTEFALPIETYYHFSEK